MGVDEPAVQQIAGVLQESVFTIGEVATNLFHLVGNGQVKPVPRLQYPFD